MNLYRKKSRKITPFTITLRKVKYVGINLIKKVKDLYNECVKTPKEKIKLEDFPCSYTGRINRVTMAIVIYRFNGTHQNPS